MRKNARGFTLVELVIVIAILGIIAMIVMPNVPSIIQRQRVKTDIITAQEIGSAVRMWYTDQKYNFSAEVEEGKKSIEDFEENIPDEDQITPIKYSELSGIETYISGTKSPTSLYPDGEKPTNPYYGVYFTTTGYVARIIVTIQDDNSTTLKFGEDEGEITANEVSYDGTRSGIAYVE